MSSSHDPVIDSTRAWLEQAVIGLNLCPFARGVYNKGQIHFVASAACDAQALTADLAGELHALVKAEAEVRDTTLLVVPHCLHDFLDFNDYLGVADDLLQDLGLEGEIQIASFHPDYRFAGTAADDVTNCTNRSPYPTLHLLREASIERAVESFPDTDAIFERNIETLQALGQAGWNALRLNAKAGA